MQKRLCWHSYVTCDVWSVPFAAASSPVPLSCDFTVTRSDACCSTAGVSLVMQGQQVVQQLQQAFDRDWKSKFAVLLP